MLIGAAAFAVGSVVAACSPTPEEKAGAAAALSETGLEFGLATGIAVFGTLGAVTGFGAVAVVAAVVSVLLAVPARLT